MRRARHYLVALGALNEAVQAGDVHLHRVDSESNRADMFTKGLPMSTHVRLGTMNLGRDINYPADVPSAYDTKELKERGNSLIAFTSEQALKYITEQSSGAAPGIC